MIVDHINGGARWVKRQAHQPISKRESLDPALPDELVEEV
jgi:hypothetical protein